VFAKATIFDVALVPVIWLILSLIQPFDAMLQVDVFSILFVPDWVEAVGRDEDLEMVSWWRIGK
jgi:hypothetical protein